MAAATSRTPTGTPLRLVAQGRSQDAAGPSRPRLGLRERKKIKTRIGIRRATYRLIAERGYEATTVEQIAEAAGVSTSTVFRYFPAKEDIFLADGFDTVLETALRARPAGEDPLDSIRLVIGQGLAQQLREERDEVILRTRLMVEIPAVRARATEAMAVTSEQLIRVLVERTGRDETDPAVRIFTAAVLGALREAVLYWAERGHQDDPIELMDEALLMLRDGLRL
ncbi:TetR/AcrR family transcriptional regulator [Streptomyces sp. NPDC055078]